MTFPTVIEKPSQLEPTARDTFIDDATPLVLVGDRTAPVGWPWAPQRRLAA
jgi:hypothetical protein